MAQRMATPGRDHTLSWDVHLGKSGRRTLSRVASNCRGEKGACLLVLRETSLPPPASGVSNLHRTEGLTVPSRLHYEQGTA